MSNVTLLSGISELSFDSHILSPFFFVVVYLIFLLLFCNFSANCPFSGFFFFLAFFLQKILQHFSFRDRLFCAWLFLNQLKMKACCYVALVFAIMHLYKNGFCPFLFEIFFFHQTEWSPLPTCMYVFFYICVWINFVDIIGESVHILTPEEV